MATYVCSGAKLKCSWGDSQSDLEVVHPIKPVILQGGNFATIMDFIPKKNINPFGKCKSILNPIVAAATAKNSGVLEPMPCIPFITSPWVKGKNDVFVKGQPALLKDDRLFCLYTGIIEITDDGQK